MLRYFGLDPSKNWTKEELIQYDNSLIAEQDKRGRLSAAYKRGLEEGKMEFLIGVVERCWKSDISLETISYITDLPMEKVQLIIQAHKK